MHRGTDPYRRQAMATEDLKKNAMMAHLLVALEEGRDIGHYGRLVFTIVARHFVDEDELVELLRQDKDVDEEKARGLVRQVSGADYSPPAAGTIRGYEEKQDFPILANPDDPDAGNVYRDLDFPESVYESIASYHEDKSSADA